MTEAQLHLALAGLLLGGVLAVVVLIAATQAFRPRPFASCRRCGYNLSGLGDDAAVCPECGNELGDDGIMPPYRYRRGVVLLCMLLLLALVVACLLIFLNPQWVLDRDVPGGGAGI